MPCLLLQNTKRRRQAGANRGQRDKQTGLVLSACSAEGAGERCVWMCVWMRVASRRAPRLNVAGAIVRLVGPSRRGSEVRWLKEEEAGRRARGERGVKIAFRGASTKQSRSPKRPALARWQRETPRPAFNFIFWPPDGK